MVDGGSEDAGMAVASIHACPRFKAFNSHKASEVARANSGTVENPEAGNLSPLKRRVLL